MASLPELTSVQLVKAILKGYEIREIPGRREWRLNGELHRTDGPAVEFESGSKFWYKNGQRHREDGPAIDLFDGSKDWFLNGKRHRVDGPASIHYNIEEYYLNGKELSYDDWLEQSKNFTS